MAASSSPPNPAEAYEQYLVPALFEPFALDLITRANLQAGERVLDLACGTGIVARHMAPAVLPGGQVDAVDMSAEMLTVANDAARRAGVAISFHQGNIQALPFADCSFDLVTCHQGLQFVPDRTAAVGEMRRVLRDGGRVLVSCWSSIEDSPLYVALAPIIQRHLGVPALNAPFALGNEGELHALFATRDFAVVQIERVMLTTYYPQPDQFTTMFLTSIVASIATLQHTTPAVRKQLIEALRADVDRALRDFIVGDQVHSPRVTQIVHAQA